MRGGGSVRSGRARALLLLVLVAIVAVLVLPGVVRRERQPAVPARVGPLPARVRIGVNASALFHPPGTAAPLLERQLGGMDEAGVKLLRFDAIWRQLEPRPGVFAWAASDAAVTALARHDMRWWPVIGYAPGWAGRVPGSLHAPPKDPAAFGAFTGAFAARYGSAGAFWREHPDLPRLPVEDYELWNEPNTTQFWPPRPDPALYAVTFVEGATAVRQADPAGRVVLGGLSPSGSAAWVGQVLTARPDAKGLIDALSLHPYAKTPDGVLGHVRAVRAALDAAGLPATPIDVTEVGWQTQPPSARYLATPEQRARRLVAAAGLLARPALRVGAFLPYAWTTPEADPAQGDDWYGLAPRDGATEDTPGTRALAYLTGTARAP